MPSISGKRLIQDYFNEFDQLAEALPPERRLVLREQLMSHLAEVLPEDASDEQVKSELTRLGSPATVLSHEPHQSQTSDNARTGRYIVGLVIVILGWVIVVPSGLLLLAGLVSLMFGLSLPLWSLIGAALSTVFGLGLVFVGRKIKAQQKLDPAGIHLGDG